MPPRSLGAGHAGRELERLRASATHLRERARDLCAATLDEPIREREQLRDERRKRIKAIEARLDLERAALHGDEIAIADGREEREEALAEYLLPSARLDRQRSAQSARQVASAATPKPKPAWAWTPFEATQILIWNIPQWNTSATDCQGSRPGGGCDYVEQASCAPIGSPAWSGHYAAFKCSVVYRHWNMSGLSDGPPQSATLYLANSRVGLGSGCVSTESLPKSCPGRAFPPRPNAVRLLLFRLGHLPAYYRCADKPNRNGVYQSVYAFRATQTVIATIVLTQTSRCASTVFGTASTERIRPPVIH